MLLEGKEAHVGCAYMNLAGKADLLRQLCVQEINQSIKKKGLQKEFFFTFSCTAGISVSDAIFILHM